MTLLRPGWGPWSERAVRFWKYYETIANRISRCVGCGVKLKNLSMICLSILALYTEAW